MVVLLLRTLMLLLKSDEDENETNADVLKRPCMCVLFLSLSRVMRCLYDRATRKVRKEKEEERFCLRKSPKIISVFLEQTNAGVSLLSLFVEKCQIETTKASQGGE